MANTGAVVVEIIVILALIAANGVFAMSELAVVSARRALLAKRAADGDRRARAALELASAPGDFLATVQVGITLVGILAGVFAGATIDRALVSALRGVPGVGDYAEAVSLTLVVLAITYLSLVVGELAPKRVALARAEAIATLVAPVMRVLSRLGRPAIRLLGASTDILLRAFRVQTPARPLVTEEEIRMLVRQAGESGVLEPDERRMVENIFRLGDRPVAALAIPRPEIDWLDVDDPPDLIRRKVEASPRTRFPVTQGGLERVLGVVHTKDLLVQVLAGEPVDLRAALRPPVYVPGSTPAVRVLQRFRGGAPQFAFSVDEYGGIQGLITANTLVQSIVGELPAGAPAAEPLIVRRDDGSWLLDGRVALDEVRDLLDVARLPGEAGGYHTLAGFVMDRLGAVPSIGDAFEWGGFRFEVVDMDDHRIDRVLVARIAPPEPPPA